MLGLIAYRRIFIGVGLIGIIIFLGPSVLMLRSSASGERFSELYLLGPDNKTQGYPFNVSAGISYSVSVGVGNHLGSSMYYDIYIKFRNQTDPLPNDTSGEPSPLPVLYTYRVFLIDNQTWEEKLAFSFSNVTFSLSNVSSVYDVSKIGVLTINGETYSIEKPAVKDSVNNGFYYQVVMELWTHGSASGMAAFNNRFVALWLNVTTSG